MADNIKIIITQIVTVALFTLTALYLYGFESVVMNPMPYIVGVLVFLASLDAIVLLFAVKPYSSVPQYPGRLIESGGDMSLPPASAESGDPAADTACKEPETQVVRLNETQYGDTEGGNQ